MCDVFGKFISACLKDDRLDPCNGYYSSPGFFWDSTLKMAVVKLQKIGDININLFLEKGRTGGVSYISNGYSKSGDDKTIMYLDMNNLYGTFDEF